MKNCVYACATKRQPLRGREKTQTIIEVESRLNINRGGFLLSLFLFLHQLADGSEYGAANGGVAGYGYQ